MAGTYKGIYVEIGGSTKKLNDAIRESKANVSELASEGKKLNSAFKFDPNMDNVNKMLENNKKSIEEINQQIKIYNQGIEKTASLKLSDEEKEKKVQSYTTAINNLSAKLKDLETNGKNIEAMKLTDFGKELELTTKKAELLRDRLNIKIDKNEVEEFQKAAQAQITKTVERLEHLKSVMADMAKTDQNAANTKEFKDLENQVISLENELMTAAKQIKEVDKLRLDNIKSQFDTVGNSLNNVSKAIAPLSASIAGLAGISIKSAIDQESAFAGVKKTVEATEAEYAKIKAELIELSEIIPVSAKELMGVAESAGQLGIAKENVVGFTRVIADLGVATNLTGEEAATTLAKFANVTNMPQTEYDRLGSTIVALGNNSATTEKDIANMSMRIAAAGSQADMTEAQIVSLAAFLSSVGLEAEAGGSTISKVISEMQIAVETGKGKLEDFAHVAGMTSAEFQKAFKEDAASALLAFIQGLANIKEDGGSAIAIIDEMGLSGIRMNDVLLRSSSAVELFNSTMALGTEAWEKNNALSEEASKRYETTESKLLMVKNQVENLGASFGELLLPMVQKIIGSVSSVVDWLNNLDDGTKRFVLTAGLFVAALAPALSIMGNMTKTVGSLITQVGTLIAAHKAQGVATTTAASAQNMLNAAMATNPIGLVVTAVGFLVAGLGAAGLAGAMTYASKTTQDLYNEMDVLNSTFESSTKSQNAEMDVIDKLIDKYEDLIDEQDGSVESKEELLKVAKELQSFLPDVVIEINKETGAIVDQTSAYRNLAQTKREYIENSARQNMAVAATQRLAELDTAIPKLEELNEQNKAAYNQALKKDAGMADVADFLRDSSGGLINIGSTISKGLTEADKTYSDSNTDYLAALKEQEELTAWLEDYYNELEKSAENIKSEKNEAKQQKEDSARIKNEKDRQAEEKRNSFIEKHRDGEAGFNDTLSFIRGREYYTDEQKKAVDEIYNYELEKVDDIYMRKALKDAYYLNDRTQLLKNESELEKELKKIADEEERAADKSAKEQQKLETKAEKENAKIAKEEADKLKTPEELYKEEKSRQDLIFNAQRESDKDYEQLLKDRIDLQSKYLVEGSDEWYRAQAEIIKFQADIEKTKADADKKIADEEKKKNEEHLKTLKNNYDNELQQLKYNLEDGIISWNEYYNNLQKLQSDNREYLSGDGNESISRGLNKEIEKSLAESQKETISNLKEIYADGEMSFMEFISNYRSYADEFFINDKKEREKIYGDISQMTANYCNDEIAAIQKMYDDEIISLDEYIKQIRGKSEELAEFYEADSDEYKKIIADGGRKIIDEKEKIYREEMENHDWARSVQLISDEEYYDILLNNAAEYLEEDSKLWRDAMKKIIDYRKAEADKQLKAYETELKDRQKVLDDNLKEEEKAIADQKKAIEQQIKDEIKSRQEAIKTLHDEKIKAIADELDAERFSQNVKIANINEEIKKRRELREDESHDDKIAHARKTLEAAQAEYDYARDDFSKENAKNEVIRKQEELDKLIQDKGDTDFYREKEKEKTEIEEQIKSLEESAKAATEAAENEMKTALESAETVSELNSQLHDLDVQLEFMRVSYEKSTEVINTLLNAERAEIDFTEAAVSGYRELSNQKAELSAVSENYNELLTESLFTETLQAELYERQAAALRDIIAMKKELGAVADTGLSAAATGAAAISKSQSYDWNSISGKMSDDDWSGAMYGTQQQKSEIWEKYNQGKAEVSFTINHAQTPEQFEKTVKDIAQPIADNAVKKAMEG